MFPAQQQQMVLNAEDLAAALANVQQQMEQVEQMQQQQQIMDPLEALANGQNVYLKYFLVFLETCIYFSIFTGFSNGEK